MYVDILLLAELTTGPKHGYEIKKNVQNRLGENFELNHNMLYPALRRFENMGAITKKIQKQEKKFFLKCYESFPKNLRQTIQNFLFVLRYLKNLTMRIEKRF
ncbi:GNAT family acetyltransferase [Bacillus thuringiensis serovar tolworthi]|uniref:GNAT family acetyltransferase n=1 Tax=Bacillus thuringiensis subsp. tolworthi TaxID=1442 RepID=A0A9W4A2W7_BACTO|nr:GNAT family acetyltransferase [Bacillus thuringiensis serovar tolworthi]